MIAVVAGSFRDFRWWCDMNPDLAGRRKSNGEAEHAVFANCIERIQGLEVKTAYLCGHWGRTPIAHKVVAHLRERGVEPQYA